MMHISVIGPAAAVAEQVRAYAEYKVFTQLAPLARHVKDVRVTVTAPGDRDAVCEVLVKLSEEGTVRTRIRRGPPVAAIDAAAESVVRALVRRLP